MHALVRGRHDAVEPSGVERADSVLWHIPVPHPAGGGGGVPCGRQDGDGQEGGHDGRALCTAGGQRGFRLGQGVGDAEGVRRGDGGGDGGGGVPARGGGEVAVFVVGILFLRADAGVAEPRVCAGAVAVGELRGERAGVVTAPAAGRDGDAVFLPERSGVRGVGRVRANRAHGGVGRDGHGRYGGLPFAAGHVPRGGHRVGFLDGGGVPEAAEPTGDGGRAAGRLGVFGAGSCDGQCLRVALPGSGKTDGRVWGNL